jgi:hypothetical protein
VSTIKFLNQAIMVFFSPTIRVEKGASPILLLRNENFCHQGSPIQGTKEHQDNIQLFQNFQGYLGGGEVEALRAFF